MFSIFGLWKFPVLSKITNLRLTWAKVVDVDGSYGQIPNLNTNTLVLTKTSPNYNLKLTEDIDVTFTWNNPSGKGQQILYYMKGGMVDTAYLKVVFDDQVLAGELNMVLTKIYSQSMGYRTTGPGGHIPDGTGPHGIGGGPGGGRADGSGYQRLNV